MNVKYSKLVEITENVIERCKSKYQKYNEYLDDTFYERLKEKLPEHYNPDNNVSPDVYLKIVADNLIIKRLCDFAKEGNLEIEIELISDYSSMLRWMMSKKHLKEELYSKDGEDILIEAIETYDNSDTFLKHIYACVKEKYQNEIDNNSIEKKVDNYVEKQELISRQPEYLELVAKELDIIKYVSKNDRLLNEFIYLKYGYRNNTYFNLMEIQEILKIDEKQVVKFYKDSITLLKDIVDLYLEEVQDEKILYAQKLLTNKKTS